MRDVDVENHQTCQHVNTLHLEFESNTFIYDIYIIYHIYVVYIIYIICCMYEKLMYMYVYYNILLCMYTKNSIMYH
jgi:hypothetical protein